MSVWQTPHAFSRTSTSPALGPARSSSVTFRGCPTSSSTAARIFMTGTLQVAHGVHRRAVDARLEVDVRAVAVARAAGLGDDLSLADVLSDRHGQARVVAVARAQRPGVLDADVVAVAADPA